MKIVKRDNYAQKLLCDWSDKKNCFFHYRMLKFYVKHGMVVEKIHKRISFKQSKRLEKNTDFNSQKRSLSESEFEKDFYELLNNPFFGKMLENVRNRLRLELFRKDDVKNNIEQQSKLTFNVIHKSYESCDSHTFKQNEVLPDKPLYLGFCVLEISQILMYET